MIAPNGAPAGVYMESCRDARIRLLTETDAEAYRELRLRALRDHPEAYSTSLEEASERPLSSFKARLRPEGDPLHKFTLGAEWSGALVGVATFDREAGIKTRHKGWITAVYVSPRARGAGLGRRMLSELLDRARRLGGLEQVSLGVGSVNEPARRLYRSLGFQVYGVEQRALKLGEQYFDEDLMTLFL